MTPAQTQQIALAHDALRTVVAWPEHVPSWWHLASCVAGLPEAERAQFVAALERVPFTSAQAQWFQQSALHHATGDIGCLRRQAELAPALPGAERWMTLANVAWWSALSHAADRAAFRQVLLDTRLPWLLDTLGAGIAGNARAREPGADVRRVAILAQHLSTGHHAPTALTFNTRAALESAGIATRVFAAQDLDLPAMRGHTGGGYVSTVAPVDPASWQLRMPGDVAVTMADVRFSLVSRWGVLGQLVDEYDPDVVLFVGFFSPLVSSLYRRHPVLGLSLHTLAPLAPVDAWLAADPHADSEPWPGLPRPLPVHFPFRFWPVPQQAVARSEVGVPADAVLLVTCGARLDPQVLAPWIDEVAQALDEQPTAHWLLVGLEPGQRELLAQRHPRIHALPHRSDAAGWIGASDVYLNPPRIGGGASVAIAMQLGVPVVALRGGDGGDKIGPLAVDTAQAYRRRIAEWVASADARRQAGERLQAQFRAELDISQPAAAARLADACRAAQRCFHARQVPQAQSATSLHGQH